MSFTSLIFFFVFFPLCLAVYYCAELLSRKSGVFSRLRIKDIVLIIASLGFYGWAGINNILFFVLFIVGVYLAGWMIEKFRGGNDKKKAVISLSAGIIILMGLLFGYKYIDFAFRVAGQLGIIKNHLQFSIMAPLGISFITFSALSYLMDIYRRDAKAGNFIDAALYLSFFPKVISGPIELWKNFSVQITRKIPDTEQVMQSINRIAIGMAKKVILADNFGSIISNIQSNVTTGIDGWTAWGGALLYMLQIYYDFAGYSDIAIGLSGLFGFRLKENFNFPYISKSITEFWRRWHISLGTWFREYLYIPLGGNRKGTIKTLRNLFIVFLFTGIWHGAGWNYILWGVINGLCVVFERCVRDKKWYVKIPGAVKWFVTMFIVFISWEIFRLPYLSDIKQYLGIMLGQVNFEYIDLTCLYFFDKRAVILMAIGIIGATLLGSKYCKKAEEMVNRKPALYIVQELGVFLLGIIVVLCMVNSTYSPFLYFQY